MTNSSATTKSLTDIAPSECHIDDDGIVRFVVHGMLDLPKMTDFCKRVAEMAALQRAKNAPVLIMINVNDETDNTLSARNEAARASRKLDIDRLSYVGDRNVKQRMLLKLVLSLFGPKFHLADDEATARAWLLR